MRKPRLSFARYSPSRRKQRKRQVAMTMIAGLCALLVGGPLLEAKYGRAMAQRTIGCLFHNQGGVSSVNNTDTTVFSLVSLPAAQRATQLEAIAFGSGVKAQERSRARYLLASDLIEQKQGQKALWLLEGLECNYPLLAAHITLKRAKAYELTGEKAKAQAQWQNLLKHYPESAVSAEALSALGKTDIKDWERVIAKFPSHPRTLKMARFWLHQNSKQPELMVLLAKYAFDTPGITSVLDKLTSLPARVGRKRVEVLKPEDWEAIALGYWKERKYGQASAAYAKAPRTPRNVYLAARGLQLAEKRRKAAIAYKQMVRDFPNAKETANALLQLAKIEPAIEVVPYLNQVVTQFPDRAGEALLAEAKVLDSLKSFTAAAKDRELLVTKYGYSEAAAEYRWKQAQAKAAAGDIEAALQWAKPISLSNPNSEQARKATFWVGKWAMRLGNHQEARAAFERVVAQYPHSYYAWRSAVFLGWDVGDFKTVRNQAPQVVEPAERPILPTGSDTLKELYKLGQDQDAWTLWQAEFKNRIEPTVVEQFTDGLLRMGAGDYLEGIAQISKLEDRETPEEKAQYQSLKRQPVYWEALYPFAFEELIKTWSKERQLNPLLVTALIRQESRFMPTIRSSADAVGLMQLIPDTGELVAQKLNLKEYDLDNPNDNVNLGTWLLDSTHQQYNNNSLLAVASYNAGSGKVSKWLQGRRAIDPDEFIEAIPYEETRDYVKQVFGNYWNYLRLYNPQVGQQVAKYSTAQPITMRP
ncbi:MAG TPA: transglycosylase SLT domain-containing protein [Oculatellaceae cyanobacterium]